MVLLCKIPLTNKIKSGMILKVLVPRECGGEGICYRLL